MGAIPKTADSVRPVFVRGDSGGPASIGAQKGEAKHAASARPQYTPPLQNPFLVRGAPPPGATLKHDNGSWTMTEKGMGKIRKLAAELETGTGGLPRSETIINIEMPEALNVTYFQIPEVDSQYQDCPMSLGHWKAQVAKFRMAFDRSPGLAATIGKQETRSVPSLKAWAEDLDKWVYRYRPGKGKVDGLV
jgi:hypothetical protein